MLKLYYGNIWGWFRVEVVCYLPPTDGTTTNPHNPTETTLAWNSNDLVKLNKHFFKSAYWDLFVSRPWHGWSLPSFWLNCMSLPWSHTQWKHPLSPDAQPEVRNFPHSDLFITRCSQSSFLINILVFHPPFFSAWYIALNMHLTSLELSLLSSNYFILFLIFIYFLFPDFILVSRCACAGLVHG